MLFSQIGSLIRYATDTSCGGPGIGKRLAAFEFCPDAKRCAGRPEKEPRCAYAPSLGWGKWAAESGRERGGGALAQLGHSSQTAHPRYELRRSCDLFYILKKEQNWPFTCSHPNKPCISASVQLQVERRYRPGLRLDSSRFEAVCVCRSVTV